MHHDIHPLRWRHSTDLFPQHCRPHLQRTGSDLYDHLCHRNRSFFPRTSKFVKIKKNYFLKYYFWLDLVSTLTISFDLVWITQFITGGGKSAANVFQITRASRAARLGTRTVRLIKLIRMIRILRQVKALNQDLAAKTKIEAPERSCQRLSKRLSSIHSRLASNRHMNRI